MLACQNECVRTLLRRRGGNLQMPDLLFHLLDHFFGLFARTFHLGELALHRSPLSAHPDPLPSGFSRLMLNETKSKTQEDHLQNANGDQEQVEKPSSPICPISLRIVYRHGGKLADSYGILIIVTMLFSAISLGWRIAICFCRGWRWQGWCLIGLALSLDVCGCLSKIIGCLRWDWGRCLHDCQEHSQREDCHRGKVLGIYQQPIACLIFSTNSHTR